MFTISTYFKTRWKRKDLIIFLENIELYLDSGLPLDRSLSILEGQYTHSRKQSLISTRTMIEQGGLCSESFKQHMNTDALVTSLIYHGESSGTLASSIRLARTMLEHREALIKKCTSAMIYPLVIGVFSCAMIIGLVRGVMPSIIPMLVSMHVHLPLMTRIVMWVSENVTRYGMLMIIISILICVGFMLLYRKISRCRYIFQTIIMYTPLIGALYKNYVVGLYMQSCGSLLQNGLIVQEAYTRTVSMIPLLPVRNYFESRTADISHGISLATVCMNSYMPLYAPALIRAGEASGNLGSSCLRVASIIDRDMDHTLKKFTSLIEPLMMAGMGIVVGGIALSIMMPIYDMSRVLQQ